MFFSATLYPASSDTSYNPFLAHTHLFLLFSVCPPCSALWTNDEGSRQIKAATLRRHDRFTLSSQHIAIIVFNSQSKAYIHVTLPIDRLTVKFHKENFVEFLREKKEP
jgi:hypothetical protein